MSPVVHKIPQIQTYALVLAAFSYESFPMLLVP
jgi:hypothetical protein